MNKLSTGMKRRIALGFVAFVAVLISVHVLTEAEGFELAEIALAILLFW